MKIAEEPNVKFYNEWILKNEITITITEKKIDILAC